MEGYSAWQKIMDGLLSIYNFVLKTGRFSEPGCLTFFFQVPHFVAINNGMAFNCKATFKNFAFFLKWMAD